MRFLVAIVVLFAFCAEAAAQVYVQGHYRSNGTYVNAHYRSSPDGNFYNNWSSYPNINPYTGATGILSVSGLGGAPLATLPPEGPAMLTGKQAYGGKGPAKAKKPGVLTTRRRR